MSRLLQRYSHILLATLVFWPLAGFASAQQPATKHPMTVEDLWNVKRVGAPSLSPDGKWAAVEVTTYNMEENDSTSDIWLLSTDGKTQRQLTSHKAKDSSPLWSPDGKHIAFISKRDGDEAQVYLISPEGGEARQLTRMPMSPSGLKWSPDGKQLFCIAWTWSDTPDDESYKKKDKAQKDSKVKAYIIDDAQYRYWDKWIADGKRPVVFAIDPTTGKHRNPFTKTKLSLVPFEPSAADYDISPDGKEICFVADSVKEIGTDINTDLYTMAIENPGEPNNITPDNPANDANPAYSPDGKHLAFLRQTTRFFYADRSRLMLHDRSSGAKRELTSQLDRSCANPKWLPDSQRITVEVEDQGVVNIGFVQLEGKVTIPREIATERSISFALDTRMGAYLRTTFDLPATVFVHGPNMQPRQIDFFNQALVAQWKLGRVEEVWFKGVDDRKVQMWVVYPPDFDPKKKWPLLQIVHGGPHNGITTDYHFRWNLHLFASRGYVVTCVNFHGSSGFGQEFTDSITGDYGTKPMLDILKATDYMETQPYIDKNRTTCAGASYGGYMMAYLNGHTDRFKAMICHAGVYNYASQMASDIVRSRQRSLGGYPWEDYAKSDKQSANRFAQNFKTPTLVIHGEKDYRVPVTQGFEYYNTLKMKGVPARLIYFPDENHWIMKPQNSRLWHEEFFAWLDKYVGHGPTKE